MNFDSEFKLINHNFGQSNQMGCNNNIEKVKTEPNNINVGYEIPALENEDKWKIQFYASHSFTSYFDTDISFLSTRYNVDIKDYTWAERSSRHFFLPETWKKEGNNPFQWIDEPTNTFTVSFEKDGHEFFLSAFLPKFLQGEDQNKYVQGTIDGVEVDGCQDIINLLMDITKLQEKWN